MEIEQRSRLPSWLLSQLEQPAALSGCAARSIDLFGAKAPEHSRRRSRAKAARSRRRKKGGASEGRGPGGRNKEGGRWPLFC